MPDKLLENVFCWRNDYWHTKKDIFHFAFLFISFFLQREREKTIMIAIDATALARDRGIQKRKTYKLRPALMTTNLIENFMNIYYTFHSHIILHIEPRII